MKEIKLIEHFDSFAENKEKARKLRIDILIPTLEKGEEIILDFNGIIGVTQSFIHALISDLFRKFGVGVLDKVTFKNCNEKVKSVIATVSDYMQAAEW
jgi:hypothetical protein